MEIFCGGYFCVITIMSIDEKLNFGTFRYAKVKIEFFSHKKTNFYVVFTYSRKSKQIEKNVVT